MCVCKVPVHQLTLSCVCVCVCYVIYNMFVCVMGYNMCFIYGLI